VQWLNYNFDWKKETNETRINGLLIIQKNIGVVPLMKLIYKEGIKLKISEEKPAKFAQSGGKIIYGKICEICPNGRKNNLPRMTLICAEGIRDNLLS
jgi:hypothetical protein